MNKQTDLQGGSASAVLQSDVLLNTARCRREGWNRCQPSISHGFPPRCSSLHPRQALYCLFPCPLPFSNISNSFLLFLIGNKKEQQGHSAALPAAGSPAASQRSAAGWPLPPLHFTPTHVALTILSPGKKTTMENSHSDLFLKSGALLPVLGISLTDPHPLPSAATGLLL